MKKNYSTKHSKNLKRVLRAFRLALKGKVINANGHPILFNGNGHKKKSARNKKGKGKGRRSQVVYKLNHNHNGQNVQTPKQTSEQSKQNSIFSGGKVGTSFLLMLQIISVHNVADWLKALVIVGVMLMVLIPIVLNHMIIFEIIKLVTGI